MKVIGAGFGRTGTTSLKLALERLGFGPCYHMSDIIERPELIDDWQPAAVGLPLDWDQVFAGYQATVDWPAAAFWRELIEEYPDAKVILTVRDPQRWYDSAAATIFKPLVHLSGDGLAFRMATLGSPRIASLGRVLRAVLVEGTFDGRIADRDHAIGVFEQHIEDVTAVVPADRLLVYEVAQGWGPLCDFLGVPVPDDAFPHANDAEAFRRHQRQQMVRSLAVPAAVTAAALATIAGGVAFARRRRRRRAL